MPPRVLFHPASRTASTISHDDIPDEPLDGPSDQGVSRPSTSHDQSANVSHRSQNSNGTVGSMTSKARAIAFHKLPGEVIQRILWAIEPDTFASAVLLNRQWYKEAQKSELYAHHLSRCPSFALANSIITGPFRKNDLLRLKTKFAAEVRRNLFQAFLRPRQTLINLISVNANSSAALPGAEAFRFAFSANGQTILAISSSRIYVLDATADPVVVRRELKTPRRPLAASVTDDGTLLAVLSSKHQANIYALNPDGVKHTQVLVMDNPPRTIALAPEGTVLAAAYEGGVEVFSLAKNALSTDRRAVRSEGVDFLTFSGDGSMLVGSTQSLEEPSAVVITAPFYTENDLPPKEVHSRMWTTQILFPQISSICSHAELLQGHTEGDANWLFAYDHTLMSYRAVRTDDTRTGVAYFLNPPAERFTTPEPSTAPTATACGTLVVTGFHGSGLWIYGVPEKLDVSPDMGSVVERHEQRLQSNNRVAALTSATGHLEPLMAYSPSISGSSEEIEEDSLAAKVEWRESLFVKCQHVKSVDGCTAVKWVEWATEEDSIMKGKRLVVVAPGGVDQFVEELGDETMPVDGSRLSILDFDYTPLRQEDREMTIEVGEKEPELLKEQIGDMEIEVAMERRRTVRDRQRGGAKMPLGRSVTTASAIQQYQWNQRRTSASTSQPTSPDNETPLGASPNMVMQSPAGSLHRSATAAGYTAARFPPRPPLSSQLESGYNMQARTTQPLAEGWESPPPPYTTGSTLVHPSMALGLPTAQARPMGSGPVPIPLGGIPENGHVLGHAHAQSVPQNFHSRHGQGSYQQSSQQPPMPQIPKQQPARREVQHEGFPGRQQDTYGSQGRRDFSNGSQLPELNIQAHPQYPPGNAIFAGPSPGGSGSRPVSRDDRSSPFPNSNSPRHPPQDRNSPQSDRLHQPSYDHQGVNKPSSSGSVTLTGANLHNRLNHPVPPTPTSEDRPPTQPNSLHQIPSNQLRPATSQSSHINGTSYGPNPIHPSIDVSDSQAKRKSLTPLNPNGAPYGASTSRRDFSGSSAGTWGVATPNSPSFNRNANMPHGIPGLPLSNSTPNLHATQPSHPIRSPYDRFGAAETSNGSYGPMDPVSSIPSATSPYGRTFTSTNSISPIVSPQHLRGPHDQPHPQMHPLSQPYANPRQMRDWEPSHLGEQMEGMNMNSHAHLRSDRRVYSDSTLLETSRKKKTRKERKAEEKQRQRGQTPTPGQAPKPVKKGGRCIIM